MTAEQARCTSLSELVDTLRAELADATRKQHAAAADANEAGEQLQVWRVQIVVRHHGDHRGMVCCGRLCMGSCVDLLPLGMP